VPHVHLNHAVRRYFAFNRDRFDLVGWPQRWMIGSDYTGADLPPWLRFCIQGQIRPPRDLGPQVLHVSPARVWRARASYGSLPGAVVANDQQEMSTFVPLSRRAGTPLSVTGSHRSQGVCCAGMTPHITSHRMTHRDRRPLSSSGHSSMIPDTRPPGRSLLPRENAGERISFGPDPVGMQIAS
jgi:hypothetical protein